MVESEVQIRVMSILPLLVDVAYLLVPDFLNEEDCL
jgi:hypothetical protein